MNRNLFAVCLLLSLLINACASAPAVVPTSSPMPSPQPSPTSEVLPVTPVESAFAPGDPTAAPLDDILERHAVSFETPDGAMISGELYGSGSTAVIFSVMGNCQPGWREFAQLTAAQGVMALTYQWRDCGPSGPRDQDQLRQNFVNDARGAIDFVREQGAEKIILAGASLGGMASAKLAAESQADGLIVFASPLEIAEWDFRIEPAEVDTDIPKLFLIAEEDPVVSVDAARALYDIAADPKEWKLYPGDEHGTDLFASDVGEELRQQLLEFILKIAAAN